MANTQDNPVITAPTKCPICGGNVVRYSTTEIIDRWKDYNNGVLFDSHVTRHTTLLDQDGAWQCVECQYKWHTVNSAVDNTTTPSRKLTICVEKDPSPKSPREIPTNISSIYLLRQLGNCMGDASYPISCFNNWRAFQERLIDSENALYIEFLYYCDDPSALSAKCVLRTTEFDFPSTGVRVGCIFTTDARIKERGLCAYDIEPTMLEELNQYNYYLTNNMWRYRIIDEDANELEVVGGFYSREDACEAGEKALEGI